MPAGAVAPRRGTEADAALLARAHQEAAPRAKAKAKPAAKAQEKRKPRAKAQAKPGQEQRKPRARAKAAKRVVPGFRVVNPSPPRISRARGDMFLPQLPLPVFRS